MDTGPLEKSDPKSCYVKSKIRPDTQIRINCERKMFFFLFIYSRNYKLDNVRRIFLDCQSGTSVMAIQQQEKSSKKVRGGYQGPGGPRDQQRPPGATGAN